MNLVIGILRTLRAIRMLKSLSELALISRLVFKSYGIISNLLLLLLLIFFSFGILGNKFSKVCYIVTYIYKYIYINIMRLGLAYPLRCRGY